MTQLTLLHRTGTLAFLIVFLSCASCVSTTRGPQTPTLSQENTVDIQGLALMLPVLRPDRVDDDLRQLQPFLRPGDMLVDGVRIQNHLLITKKAISGLRIGVGGTSVEDLEAIVDLADPSVDALTYDYEPDFTPEWTAEMEPAIEFFKQAAKLAHRHGMDVVVVPVYVFSRSWDWGKVIRDGAIDILVLQVQNYQTGARVPPALDPENLGENLIEVTTKVTAQIRSQSPTAEVFLQFDLMVTDRIENVLLDIERTKNLGIDGYTLWYSPSEKGLQRIVTLLSHLTRS